MTNYELRTSDHLFEAFLAGCGDRFTGVEKRMHSFFKSHPGQAEYAAVQAAIRAYAKSQSVGSR